MIDRRNFANVVALGLLGAPVIARAQPAQRLPVVGVLSTGTARGRHAVALVKGLGQLGYVEGKNLAFKVRFGGGRQAALPGFAADFVKQSCDPRAGARACKPRCVRIFSMTGASKIAAIDWPASFLRTASD